MARLLLHAYHHHHHLLPFLAFSATNPTLLLIILIATIAAVASIITSLCTTHKHHHHSSKKPTTSRPTQIPSSHTSTPPLQNNKERKLASTLSGMGSKALVVAKMISWKRTTSTSSGYCDEDDQDEEAVWKKSILMGEKCRPLEFSGQILYDSEGIEVKEKN